MACNATQSLKEFFLKVLTIQKSTQSINDTWLDSIKLSYTPHIFTDPFNVDIQSEKEQVDFFNKLLGRSDTEIKWAKKGSSGCKIIIDETNKKKVSLEFLSNIYCQLSVPVFEHICVFLKTLLQTNSSKSINIINEFDIEFRQELVAIDDKKLLKTPTILILHNLRLFRNCITHSGGLVQELENDFIEFNRQIKEDKKFKTLQFYGGLQKERFYYSITDDVSNIQLNNSSFIKLLDLYSQIAYLAYLCYCSKNNIQEDVNIF